MEKYIIQLKESPWRRLLRYLLWVVLALTALLAVFESIKATKRAVIENRGFSSTEKLLDYDPLRAISQAEALYRKDPSAKTRSWFLNILIKEREWTLADALLDPWRPCSNLEYQLYDLIVTSHISPASIPTLLANFKPQPQSNYEKILLGMAAREIDNQDLRTVAKHYLREVDDPSLKDRAMLLAACIAHNENDNLQAKDLAAKLWNRQLSPRDSIELLGLCEKLKLSESADYESALKIQARESAPLAVCLANHLAETQGPQTTAVFLKSLSPKILQNRLVLIKTAEFLAKEGKRDEGVLLIQKINSRALESSLVNVMRDENPPQNAMNASEVLIAAGFAHELHNYKKEALLLQQLNACRPSLWALNEEMLACEETHDEPGIIQAGEALTKIIGGSLITESRTAFWKLLAYNADAKPLYERLKSAIARYPSRTDIMTTLALCHYRLGNLTDALEALPQTPDTASEKLVAGYLLAQARQYEKSSIFLKDLPIESLSPSELALYDQALGILQANAPLERWLEIFKAPK